MTEVRLDDSKLGDVSCEPTTLAPAPTLPRLGLGAVALCGPVDYTVTQADADIGYVHNEAIATGRAPTGDRMPSLPATADIPSLESVPGIAVTKSAELDDRNDNGLADAGETIQYSFVVRNTGNVTLTGVGVDDARIGSVSCPRTTLVAFGPDSVMTCTADDPYLVTEADVASGSVSNTATAHGTSPDGERIVSPPSTTETATTEITIDPGQDHDPDQATDDRLPETGAGPLTIGALVLAVLCLCSGAAMILIGRKHRLTSGA